MPDHLHVLLFCSIQIIINFLNARPRGKNRKFKIFTSKQE